MEALDQIENAFGAPFVQVSGRLVRQKQRGLIHQGTRDRHSLLFAAGKFSRTLPRARSPARPRPANPSPLSALRPRRLPSNQQGHRHIFRRREIRQQVMPLPHKTHHTIAILR